MERNFIKITIEGIEYTIIAELTLSTVISISNEDENSYKLRVAKAIQSSIKDENKPALETILNSEGNVFQKYIESIVSFDPAFGDFYQKCSITEPICERFCKAVSDYYKESFKKVSDNITEFSNSMGKSIKVMMNVLDNGIQITNNFYNQIIFKQINIFSKLQKKLQKSLEGLWNIDWKKYEYSYTKWGEFGWPSSWNVSIYFYNNIPININEADRLAIGLLNKDELNSIFDDLRKICKNDKDLESSIFCFNNKQYKACAMLLCSMIEAPLIREQENKDDLKVGSGAVRIFSNDRLSRYSIENRAIIYLQLSNTIAFLKGLFARTDSFKTEPKFLNRNFLAHGMSKRYVRKKDCIKLFFGLYNVLKLIEY